MKNLLLILVTSASLMHGAESPTTIELQTYVTAICNAMIRSDIDTIKKGSNPKSLYSSVGKMCMNIDYFPPEGISKLGTMPEVVAQTHTYTGAIQADEFLCELIESAKLAQKDRAHPHIRTYALGQFAGQYMRLQKALIEQDIPGFHLHNNFQNTIEKNTEVTLTEKQQTCLNAALLSCLGLILQKQWEIDAEAFKLVYQDVLPRKQSPSYADFGNL